MEGRLPISAALQEQSQALLAGADHEEALSSSVASLPTTEASSQDSFLLHELADSDIEASLNTARQVAPDQFIEGCETTKWEIWAYYLFYAGNTGLTLTILAPIAMQNLVSQAAREHEGVLIFFGRERTVNSIVLLSNALSSLIQFVIFLVIGSLADFGNWRSSILIVQSLLGIIVGFSWLGIHRSEHWRLAVDVYIVGLIAFQTSLTYFCAAFPGLARNTPTLRKKAEELTTGVIDRQEYDDADSMMRNRISNTSLWVSGIGGTLATAVILVILYSNGVANSTESNSWGLSLALAFGSLVWLVFAIPWFFLEKRRPGQPIPIGYNIITAGLWQLYRAATQIWRLKQSLGYLLAYFLLHEALSTSVAVIATLQNQVAEYNAIRLMWLTIVQYAASTIGLYTCIQLQRRYALSTKTMLCGVACSIALMNAWGLLGIWTETVGYHRMWEFWVLMIHFGALISPWFSVSQTMISEITPRGKEYLFFSLFNIVGKVSSFMGPLVSSVVIDVVPSHNPSTPFLLLTATSILGFLIMVVFVDVGKSRREQERYLEEERQELLGMAENLRQKGI